MEGKEKRIRAITKLYYSNPKIQEAIVKFSANREVVPRYFEGFGKRPDMIQYPSDVMGMVNRGATSFHASEEIWDDPLKINSDMHPKELSELRRSWDLLIDIDSPFLDFSKIAAKLLLEELERHGVNNYGIKFSGSKGFHIMVSGKAFPREHEGQLTKNMFPEWPRAICEYLMNRIKPRFAKETHNISNIKALEIRTNKKIDQLVEVVCPQCGKPAKRDKLVTLKCNFCSNEVKQKKSVIAKKRVLRCGNCLSIMDIINEEDFFECLDCKISNISRAGKEDSKNVKYVRDANRGNVAEMATGLHEDYTGGFDLVLVASRHLFRMPYSLHEKTALASAVLTKSELDNFSPKDATAMGVKIREYLPNNTENEGRRLLSESLEWKRSTSAIEEKSFKKYDNYEQIDISGVKEEMFPDPIKKLLKGLTDGRKRGLFILITFLRSLNFPADYMNQRIREWNNLNDPPLKEGYVKSQIEWHLKQKKKILPPNYENKAFYADLGLLDKKPDVKNPIVEVIRKARREKK